MVLKDDTNLCGVDRAIKQRACAEDQIELLMFVFMHQLISKL